MVPTLQRNALSTSGAPKYLFSTLLQCGQCGANFVMVDKAFYACSSFKHGGPAACTNNLRIKRTLIQEGLVRGIRRMSAGIKPDRAMGS